MLLVGLELAKRARARCLMLQRGHPGLWTPRQEKGVPFPYCGDDPVRPHFAVLGRLGGRGAPRIARILPFRDITGIAIYTRTHKHIMLATTASDNKKFLFFVLRRTRERQQLAIQGARSLCENVSRVDAIASKISVRSLEGNIRLHSRHSVLNKMFFQRGNHASSGFVSCVQSFFSSNN